MKDHNSEKRKERNLSEWTTRVITQSCIKTHKTCTHWIKTSPPRFEVQNNDNDNKTITTIQPHV